MEKAVDAMGPASDQLRGQQFKTALTPEQKALQYLLRAEATFRQIQVAFGKRWRWRWWRRRSQPRSREHVRSRTRYRKESVRKQPAIRSGEEAESRRRRAREIERTRTPPAGNGAAARQQTADRPTALAAGNAPPRSRRASQSRWSKSPAANNSNKQGKKVSRANNSKGNRATTGRSKVSKASNKVNSKASKSQQGQQGQQGQQPKPQAKTPDERLATAPDGTSHQSLERSNPRYEQFRVIAQSRAQQQGPARSGKARAGTTVFRSSQRPSRRPQSAAERLQEAQDMLSDRCASNSPATRCKIWPAIPNAYRKAAGSLRR